MVRLDGQVKTEHCRASPKEKCSLHTKFYYWLLRKWSFEKALFLTFKFSLGCSSNVVLQGCILRETSPQSQSAVLTYWSLSSLEKSD
ncbi:uncharacterized protein AAG666_015455 isoform 3-T8 [Megaptera novaeangliae]